MCAMVSRGVRTAQRPAERTSGGERGDRTRGPAQARPQRKSPGRHSKCSVWRVRTDGSGDA